MKDYTSCCVMSVLTCEVLLDVNGACEAAKVAMEVIDLSFVEVFVADRVNVVGAVGVGEIDLVLVD